MKFEYYHSIEKHWNKETENNNKVLILTGLSGSGKDYLLRKFKESGNLSTNISTYSFGEKLFEEIKKWFPELKNRDRMRVKLSEYDLVSGVNNAIEQILKEQPVILNTHTVYRQGNGLSITPDFDKKIKAGSYVYV